MSLRSLSWLFPWLAALTVPGAVAAGLDASFASLEMRRPQPCRPVALQELSLSDALDQALCANPATREAWAAARAQAALAGVAEAAEWPALHLLLAAQSARAPGASERRQESAKVALSWLIYDFGERAAAIESARQWMIAADASQNAVVQDILQAVVQGFHQVHAARAALAAALESEKSFAASLQAAQARYRVGSATPADQLQAQTAHSQARLARIQAEGSLQNALGGLATLIGQEANQKIGLRPPPEIPEQTHVEEDVAALIAQAKKLRPDLQAAEAKARAAQADVAANRAAGLPRLGLGAEAGVSQGGNGERNGWQNASSIGLTLSVPLFTGFANTYKVKAAQAQQEAREANRDRLRQQVALEVWTAYQNLMTANHSLQATRDLLASAQRSEQVALGRYQAGLGSILDVLSAQSALARARQQRIQAGLDWNVSRTALALAIGHLDADFINRLSGGSPAGKDPS